MEHGIEERELSNYSTPDEVFHRHWGQFLPFLILSKRCQTLRSLLKMGLQTKIIFCWDIQRRNSSSSMSMQWSVRLCSISYYARIMTGFREMVESNCGRKIHKGELYSLVGTLKLYNLLQCGTSRTLNGIYKGLLTTGTNCLKRTQ